MNPSPNQLFPFRVFRAFSGQKISVPPLRILRPVAAKHQLSIFSLLFLFAAISLAVVGPACAQGTFQNLDFESPILPLNPVNNQVPIGNALPGWTGYGGGIQVGPSTPILYNAFSFGAAEISLQGPGSPVVPILQGSYTAFLIGSTAGEPTSVGLGQTGQIPGNAESIEFLANSFGSFQVSFAGHPITLVPLATSSIDQTVGGDISAYAGQTGQLLFTALPNIQSELDDIQFSPTPVPEPGTWALLAAGGLLLTVRRPRTK
jgi:hypothetical protein